MLVGRSLRNDDDAKPLLSYRRQLPPFSLFWRTSGSNKRAADIEDASLQSDDSFSDLSLAGDGDIDAR